MGDSDSGEYRRCEKALGRGRQVFSPPFSSHQTPSLFAARSPIILPGSSKPPQTRRPSQHAQPKRSCIGDACHLLLHGSHRCGYSVWSCSRVILMQAMISLSCSHYASAQRRRCSCLQVRLPRVQRRERQDLSLCEFAAASRRHRNWTDIRAFRLHKLNGHFRTRSVWLNPS